MKNKNFTLQKGIALLALLFCGVSLQTYATDRTWTGGAGTDWTVNGNWDTQAPGSGDKAIIPNTANDPVISGSVTISELEIQNNGVVDIATTGVLIVTNTGATCITIANNAQLNLNGSAYLTIGGTISGDGTLAGANGTDGLIQVAGDFTINAFQTGDFTLGNLTVEFNGTALQHINNPTGSYTFNNLVISNTTNGVELDEDMEVDLVLSGSGTLIANTTGGTAPSGGVVLKLFGDMTVNQFTANNSVAYFQASIPGTGTQSIGASTGYTFYDVVNLNDATTLLSDIYINHVFDFDQGKVIMGNFNVQFNSGATLDDVGDMGNFYDLPDGSDPGDYNNDMYFVTNGNNATDGLLIMDVTEGLSRDFPVGPTVGTNDYNLLNVFFPITAGNPSSSTFNVKVFTDLSEDDGDNITNDGVDRTWLALQHSTGDLTGVTTTHEWRTAQENAGFTRAQSYISWRNQDENHGDPNGVYAWHPTQSPGNVDVDNNPVWQRISGSIGSSSTMINHGKYFLAIGDNGAPLPVTWLSFDANYSNKQASLNWKTATETNNSHFEVQRSTDGKTWQNVGRVDGRGNSRIVNAYTFTDKSAGSLNLNTIYYRLKQVDYNGQFEYSAVKVVRPAAEPVVETYPNPAADKINVSAEVSGAASIQLLNAGGMLVYTEQFNASGKVQKVINLEMYPKGMYFIRITSDAGSTTKTIYKN